MKKKTNYDAQQGNFNVRRCDGSYHDASLPCSRVEVSVFVFLGVLFFREQNTNTLHNAVLRILEHLEWFKCSFILFYYRMLGVPGTGTIYKLLFF